MRIGPRTGKHSIGMSNVTEYNVHAWKPSSAALERGRLKERGDGITQSIHSYS